MNHVPGVLVLVGDSSAVVDRPHRHPLHKTVVVDFVPAVAVDTLNVIQRAFWEVLLMFFGLMLSSPSSSADSYPYDEDVDEN
jgi:hypothetical protein